MGSNEGTVLFTLLQGDAEALGLCAFIYLITFALSLKSSPESEVRTRSDRETVFSCPHLAEEVPTTTPSPPPISLQTFCFVSDP